MTEEEKKLLEAKTSGKNKKIEYNNNPQRLDKSKPLDAHIIAHTHWDREWYFTSDDSRTMLHYTMNALIDYLEKNEDAQFTFDGQSSIIDDYLKFAPEWKSRLKKVVKAKKLFVGPFYTQISNTMPKGEAIMRNLEIGIDIAENIGHSMKVGYLPDTFGHNNQIPQILKMNDIDNMTFYRGFDPLWNDNNLFFNYVGPDGSSILGHWQTHYVSHYGVLTYEFDKFEYGLIADHQKPGEFLPSVSQYAKRNYGLPISYPLGMDQRPWDDRGQEFLKVLDKKYKEYNLHLSNYETFLKDAKDQIKEHRVELKTVTTELRTAKSGRVHRSAGSSRQDVKQTTYKLENILINHIEPLAIMCHLNKIDVPWKMIEYAWKELFKSSAHDSYSCSNSDQTNEKIKQRNENAIKVLNSASAMMTKIYALNNLPKVHTEASFEKLFVFNTDVKPYSGNYTIQLAFKDDKYVDYKFEIKDENGKVVPYHVIDTDNENMDKKMVRFILKVENLKPLSMQEYSFKFLEKTKHEISKSKSVENKRFQLSIKPNKMVLFDKKTKVQRENFFTLASDASNGDTYDHSPITFDDKKYVFNKFKVLKTISRKKDVSVIEVEASVVIPNGLKDWKANKPTVVQTAKLIISLNNNSVRINVEIINNSLNARVIALIPTDKKEESWIHDQQFGIYKRDLINEYMKDWKKKDKYGYKWVEYPTNLSTHMNWISTVDNKLNVFTEKTREHQVIDWNDKTAVEVVLYRAFGKLGVSKVAWRPGRSSGGDWDAPKSQLLGKKLKFDFIISYDTMSNAEKFDFTRNLIDRPSYVPGSIIKDKILLAWDWNTPWYDKSKSKDRNIKIDKSILNINNNFKQTALYKTPKGDVILRLLNVSGEPQSINLKNAQYSFANAKYKKATKEIIVPQWKLINIKLGK